MKERMLVVYSLIATLGFGIALGATVIRAQVTRQRIVELDVERINIVDSSGRVHLVIANAERMPNPIVGGQTVVRTGGNRPGMLFYNERGDEIGGLMYYGSQTDGMPNAGVTLAFDQYGADQIVGMRYSESNNERWAGFNVWDQAKGGERQHSRVFLGKMPDGSAVLALADEKGVPRLGLQVDIAGKAAISFLDENGKVTNTISQNSPALAR